ncbi:hypothetical protein ABFP37_20590 [Burkholderia sp. RS01]|uniref:hypothetical protein n=1 Tax=unclassified Burkholderia TaxID=2613784 RepID=UPI003218B4C8
MSDEDVIFVPDDGGYYAVWNPCRQQLIRSHPAKHVPENGVVRRHNAVHSFCTKDVHDTPGQPPNIARFTFLDEPSCGFVDSLCP